MSGSGLMSKQSSHKSHLLQVTGGIAAEVQDLRNDIQAELKTAALITVEEWTNPAAASTTALKTATATTTSAVVLSASDFTGNGVLGHARQITATTAGATPAHAPATARVIGLDVDGKLIEETLTLAQTAATVTSNKCFKSITRVEMPAGDGAGATISWGFAAPLGLPKAIKARAGLTAPLKEIVNGAEVNPSTGTFTTASANPPYGTYTPASAANGTNDYALFYEGDATV